MNAVTHGLSSKLPGLVDDEERIQQRLQEWLPRLKPEGPIQLKAAEKIAGWLVRIDRCEEDEHAHRRKRANRAVDSWVSDRQIEAAALGAKIEQRPELVACKLGATLYGCEWLLIHLRALESALRGPGGELRPLGEENRERACDLLGVALDVRENLNPLDLTGKADENAIATHQATLIADEIARLEEKCGTLVARDHEERSDAAAGLGIDTTIRLIRRYHAQALRELERARAELTRLQAEDEAARKAKRNREMYAWMRMTPLHPVAEAAPAEPTPAPVAEPAPTAAPAVEPAPTSAPVAEPAPKPAPAVEPAFEPVSLEELQQAARDIRHRAARAACRGV